MPIMTWNKKLELGVGSIDNDHKNIVESMNALFDLFSRQATHAEIEKELSRLVHVSLEHFRREEIYMSEITYKDLETHKLVHANLIEHLNAYLREFQLNGRINPDFFNFLKFWLSGHILGIDKRYTQNFHK